MASNGGAYFDYKQTKNKPMGQFF